MQKLTLTIDDDLYAMLHTQVGRGSIGRFISDVVRPHLSKSNSEEPASAFGMLSHLAKPASKKDEALAKRRYMAARYAAKNGA